MNSDDRIIELLSDILVEQKGMRKDINELKEQQMITNNRLEKLEEQQAKTNLAIGELRLSVMKLADRLEIITDHEKRIAKLEHTVYNT